MDQALRDKMCARMREVQTQVAERDELIEVIAIALLTRKNVFVLGDTGQAKSAVINLFRDGLTGARQFERLMSKQADEEALFGRLDLSSLIPGGVPEEILEEDALYQEMRRDLETLVLNYRRGDASFGQQLELATTELERYRKALSELHGGEPRIITKGKLPDSHIVFLDEIFKASDGILNALLTALNERRYTNEGKTIHIPTISFFSASNEIPNFTNPEEKILKPLYDRFELKVVTEYVEDRAARLKILKQKQAAPHLAQAPAAPITLEELEAMQDDVRQVHILDSINELMDDVLCALREKGIHISDRKYFNYAPVAQAKAWLEGRDTVAPADLIILAAAQESYQEFEDDSGAAPARRIGKLREEYLMLYEKLSAMRAEAQDDIGRQKVDACMEDLEAFNKKAFSEDGVSGVFSYVPLKELYLLKAN